MEWQSCYLHLASTVFHAQTTSEGSDAILESLAHRDQNHTLNEIWTTVNNISKTWDNKKKPTNLTNIAYGHVYHIIGFQQVCIIISLAKKVEFTELTIY